ncbi:butyrophilin-like protein 2 [Acanthopagrus schlegelii]
MNLKIVLSFVGLVAIVLLITLIRNRKPTPRTDPGESDLNSPVEPKAARLVGSQPVQEKDLIRCSAGPVAAVVGQHLTLDCQLEPQQDVTMKVIEWLFNKKGRVLVYKSKDFSPGDQAEQFRDRASLGSSWDLTKGKIPVIISSVREDDAGTYSCSVRYGNQLISCSIQVTVGPKEQLTEPGKTPAEVRSKAPDQNGATLALALFISTFLCLLCY